MREGKKIEEYKEENEMERKLERSRGERRKRERGKWWRTKRTEKGKEEEG